MPNQEYSVRPILIGNNIRIKIRQALEANIIEDLMIHIYDHTKGVVHFRAGSSKYEYHYIKDKAG